jgi:HEAT repeat protein
MKRRRVILFVLLLVAIIGAFAWVALTPRDPVYAGKPLTQWVDQWTGEIDTASGMFMDARIGGAWRFREFGPSAVPELTRIMETRHPWKQKLYDYLVRHKVKYRWATDFTKKWYVESQRPQTAATMLRFAGPGAESAIPALMTATLSTNQDLSRNAIYSLGVIHQRPEVVIPFLIKLTTNQVQIMRIDACNVLGMYTQRPDVVVPVLIQSLSNQSSAWLAALRLGRFGTNALAAVSALREVAINGPAWAQPYAAEALQRIDPDSTLDATVAAYIRVLQGPNSPRNSASMQAVFELYELGPRARPAVPALLEFISGGGSSEAAYALKAIDPEAAARIWQSELSRWKRSAPTNSVQPSEPETPEHFAARVTAEEGPALLRLITILEGRKGTPSAETERANAARMLGDMGPAAQAAVPALISTIDHTSPYRAALMKIRGQPVSLLIEKLKANTDSFEWFYAAAIVGEFGTNAEPAIPVILSTLQSPYAADYRTVAVLVLGEIHYRPDLCLPALTSMLGVPPAYVRKTALEALAKFGADAKPAVPSIIESLEDLDYYARVAATNALKIIDPEAAAKAGIK